MDGFQAELLQRLPLAQAVLRGFGYMLDPATLAEVFREHRGRCYEDILRFDQLVYLIRDALTVHHGSGQRAFTAAKANGQLPVAEQNVYGKLARLPETLSEALLAAGATRLQTLLPIEASAVTIPSTLAGLKLIAFDGKKLKNAAKRLKPLRGVPGKLLGGKLLVALDVARGLVLAMSADLDGERNDVPLVPKLVAQVRAREAEPILWLGDRQFGNLGIPALLGARPGDHYLVRCPKSLTLHTDPQRSAESFVDAEGRTVRQAWGWIGSKRDARRRYLRRITLERPGEEAVILVTDLTDGACYPAADLLAAYRLRWGIERVFQEVTEVFSLQTLIGATPQAMIFQAAMCFLLYNLIQVVRAYLAAEGHRPVEQVSSEKLFWDVRDQLTTWTNLGEPEVVVCLLAVADAAPPAMRSWLRPRCVVAGALGTSKRPRNASRHRRPPGVPKSPGTMAAIAPHGASCRPPRPLPAEAEDHESSGVRLPPSRTCPCLSGGAPSLSAAEGWGTENDRPQTRMSLPA